MAIKMLCDLCNQESELVQRCAFGPFGRDINLHPWCQDEFRDMDEAKQDQILRGIRARQP